MRKAFIDTNVLIDFLGERDPFYDAAARIVSRADRKEIELMASSLSYATASYILLRYNPHELVMEKLKKFTPLCTVTNVGAEEVNLSLCSAFSDFEDALQYYSAWKAGATVIITRNKKDFRSSSLPVYTPDEFLSL